MYKYNIWYLYQSTQQFHNKQINTISLVLIYLCGSIATCFDPVGSSSGNHHMNMPLIIGLFANMDPDQ
jgi:hypothetical protein